MFCYNILRNEKITVHSDPSNTLRNGQDLCKLILEIRNSDARLFEKSAC